MKTFYLSIVLASLCLYGMAQPTQPSAPQSCNANTCTAPVSETCSIGSNVVTDFRNGSLFSGPANFTGAVYRFANVANVLGQQINATVQVDAIYQATLDNIDDDAATDQDNNSIINFLAPRIGPDQNLTGTDRRGYVQFTITFFADQPGTANDYSVLQPLVNLNYIHYDIDGTQVGNGGWFRETGVIKSVTGLTILGDASTELSAYNYSDGGTAWTGFAGSVCERTGVSRCAQVAAAARFMTQQSSVTVRMGYDYNRTNSNFNSMPVRQYGTRFGCFTFPTQITLPVKLIYFRGTDNNNAVSLSWETSLEENIESYAIERSADGSAFETIGHVDPAGVNHTYTYTDPLSTTEQKAFYRLRMDERDGKFSYSPVILIRRNTEIGQVNVLPNPFSNSIQFTMSSTANQAFSYSILTTDGRTLRTEKGRLSKGNNSFSITDLDRLTPGLYILQISTGEEIKNLRLIKK